MSEKGEWIRVNKPEDSIHIDYGSICSALTDPSGMNPIDNYFRHSMELVVKAAETDDDPMFLRLLLLGVVSNAEHYFRQVLASTIEVCPFVKKYARRRTMSLGAVEYYGNDRIGLGLLEQSSLSGKGNLKTQTKNITGVEIKNNSSADVALLEFERICHLRHAIVHSRGELASHNCVELGVPVDRRRFLELTRDSYQNLVANVHSAVRSYNLFLCNAILRRWHAEKHLVGDWRKDEQRFSEIYMLFFSREDNEKDPDPKGAYQKLLPIFDKN